MKHLLISMALLSFSVALNAQQSPPIPDDVRAHPADIWSEGTRMRATVYAPTAADADEKLPTILMAHGWGGIAAQLRAMQSSSPVTVIW